jgi:tRNA A37 methylthiotransferase MiaB
LRQVGFPGETEDDFQQLVDFVEQQRIDHVGIFQFSPEPMSDAARAQEQVSAATKSRRYKLLTGKQRAIAREKVKQFVGKKLTVVVDAVTPAAESEGGETRQTLVCRHRGQAPDVDGVVLVQVDAPSQPEPPADPTVTPNPKSSKRQPSWIGKRIEVEITGYDVNLNLLAQLAAEEAS